MDLSGPNLPGMPQPIAKVGEVIALESNDGFYIYRVGFIESFPIAGPMVIDITSGGGIPAATSSVPGIAPENYGGPNQQNNVLNMTGSVLAQLRLRPLSDFQVLVSEPGPNSPRSTVANTQLEWGPFDVIADPNGSRRELWVFANNSPVLQARTVRQYAASEALVALYGIKYVLSGPQGYAANNQQLQPLAGPYATINDLLADKSGWKDIIVAIVPFGGIGR